MFAVHHMTIVFFSRDQEILYIIVKNTNGHMNVYLWVLVANFQMDYKSYVEKSVGNHYDIYFTWCQR